MVQRKRTEVQEPKAIDPNCTLYEYLQQVGLVKKIVDIAIAQEKAPSHLRREYEQEIFTTWSQYKPDLRFKPGQIAAYAHQAARHAVLRVRREIGGPVTLPSSAFRKKKDGTTYVTPGALAAPLNWNEMEDWLKLDDQIGDAATLIVGGLNPMVSEENEEGVVSSDRGYHEVCMDRVAALSSCKGRLSERQLKIAEMLLIGEPFSAIQDALGIKKHKLLSEMESVKRLLGNQD